MDLSLSETQNQLSESVRTYLGRLTSTAMVASAPSAPGPAWQALSSELGILSLMLDEEDGGFGGRGEDLLVVMEAMGEHLFSQPFSESAVVALALLKVSSSKRALDLIASTADGAAQISLVIAPEALVARNGGGWTMSGDLGLVYPGPTATDFLILTGQDQDDVRLFAVKAAAASIRPVATIDERWAGHLVLTEADAELLLEGDEASAAKAYAQDIGLACICAEASGILSKLLDDTVEFSKQRRQFGQPIGRFQVLQHRMADMLMHHEMARSAAMLACLSLNLDPVERLRASSAAKIVISEACRFIGQNAVQLHGGLGMSAETDMTRWFKRATVIEYQLGGRDHHIERYMRAA